MDCILTLHHYLDSPSQKEHAMFARIVEIFPKAEKKEEFLKIVQFDVIPLLKKQTGFLEVLPLVPENEGEKTVVVTLWAEKKDAERYVRELFPKISEIVRPYLLSPISSRHYKVETSMCEHLVEALAA
jgi:quinol monooxygenase YgiN